jgi:hypothetical protein
MPLPIDDALLAGLLSYWETARGTRPMPTKTDIDPVRLGAKLLPHVLLVELVAGGRLRYRLCGTALIEAAGADITGKHVDELYPNPAYTGYIDGLYRRCIAERRPIYSESRYLASSSSLQRTARRLICPIAGEGAPVERFITGQTFAFSPSSQGIAPTVMGADAFEPGLVEAV